MTWRATFAALAALLLAACGDGGAPRETPPPSPLIYEIASSDGRTEGWLLGTIHALPAGVEWRTEPIEAAIANADVLVVEVASFDDADAHARLFAQLAVTPDQPPLDSKVPPELRGQLAQIMADGNRTATDFARTETWAAAIMLAQVVRHGDSTHGVDRAVIAAFAGRPVVELEGIERQLAMFDALPEQDQRDMLVAVVERYSEARDDPGALTRIWLAGDVAGLEEELSRGMLADPELYEALLAGRNRTWADRIIPLLQAEPRPLVAVGAAHIVGPHGLPALLEARGYTVRRIE